jgi:hypothetical protein
MFLNYSVVVVSVVQFLAWLLNKVQNAIKVHKQKIVYLKNQNPKEQKHKTKVYYT